MLIQTKFLGEVEIKESEIITFEQGLPGFLDYQKFIILPLDADLPLALFQSIDESTIGFVIAFPFAFKSDYAFDLSDEEKEDLQIEKEEEVLTYSIVTLQEIFTDSTMNLLAPIVINTTKKLGKQIILQDSKSYPLRFQIQQSLGSAK
ncbi:flagellar assembly protein FliW [Solibacillus sp. MA9]|uniref:Flagellar assembly factor FliW n=1 Tax=Solibacillus palustris TaxID=2908203 RepID=A0ABS9U902_9BACL|nr:flagellar assembly protein FliW [Solibacillus sp. MA9]MCH7320649.1 flagellar assembly protein FliW [Solibacillus sp. MA9]